MALPEYFQDGEPGEKFYSTGGDRVYGTITIKGAKVTYRFNDGQRPYTEVKEFDSESNAQDFASRFAAEMNTANKRNSVLTTDTFRRSE